MKKTYETPQMESIVLVQQETIADEEFTTPLSSLLPV